MATDCRDTALRYLEHKERSTFEVKAHLLSKGFREEEIKEELEYLKELRYLDDVRYCGDYIRYGAGKGRGPVRLQQELSEKGVDSSTIREALEECFDRETERRSAMREAEKLLGYQSPAGAVFGSGIRDDDEDEAEGGTDEKTAAKIGRRLHALGYHTDVIYDVLRKIRNP